MVDTPSVTKGLSALKRELKDRQDIIAALEAIDNIASLNRATTEAQARKDAAENELEAVQQELVTVRGKVSSASTDLTRARDAVANQLKEANEKVKELIANAHKLADEIVTEAKTAKAKIDEEVAAKNDELLAMKDQLTRGNKQIADIEQKKRDLVASLGA